MKSKITVKFIAKSIYLIILLVMIGGIYFDYDIVQIIRDKSYDIKIKNVKKIEIFNNGQLGNTVGNINNYGHAVENDDYIYYLKDNIWLCRSNKSYGNEETLIKRDSGNGIWHLNLVGDYLIYKQGDELIRREIDGGKSTKVPTKKYMIDLHIVDDWIYYVNFNRKSNGIHKMTINGENVQQLCEAETMGMALYGGRIYYSDMEDELGSIYSMDLNGDDKVLIANIKTRNMIVEENSIFYMGYDDFKFYRFNRKTKAVDLLIDEKLSSFCKVDQWVYFSKFGDGKYDSCRGLYKASLDGKLVKMLTSDHSIEGLSVIDKWIMYTSTDDNTPSTLNRLSIENDQIIPMD